MSATPKTLKEASLSLQKFIDHPRTVGALRAQAPRRLVEFRGSRPHGYISKKLAIDYNDSWKLKIVGKLWLNMFFVAPMSDGQHVLNIFVESEIEDAKARFGLWNMTEETIREIKPSEISYNLEKMQYVYKTIVEKTIGGYETPEVPQYI